MPSDGPAAPDTSLFTLDDTHRYMPDKALLNKMATRWPPKRMEPLHRGAPFPGEMSGGGTSKIPISRPRLLILQHLEDAGDIPQAALLARAGYRIGEATGPQHLQRLERLGLIRRTDADHRKHPLVGSTAKIVSFDDHFVAMQELRDLLTAVNRDDPPARTGRGRPK